MTIQWARIHRGRVWHMFWPGGPVLCNSELVPWETNIGMPPRGGVPCQPCEAAMKEAWEFAEAAVLAAQQAHDEIIDRALGIDLSDDLDAPYVLDNELVEVADDDRVHQQETARLSGRRPGSLVDDDDEPGDDLVEVADEVVAILVSNAAATLDAEGSDD